MTRPKPLVLLILILFLHLAAASSSAGKDLKAASGNKVPLETICDHALYPKVCMSLAQPADGPTTIFTSIVKLHLDSALRNSKHPIRWATDNEDNPKAIKALEAGDKESFMADMSSVFSYYDECKVAFKRHLL